MENAAPRPYVPTEQLIAQFLKAKPEYRAIPEAVFETLVEYTVNRRPTGQCTQAIISNDLKEAFARADQWTTAAMPLIVRWLYNEAPAECWGSPERYRAWLAGGVQ